MKEGLSLRTAGLHVSISLMYNHTALRLTTNLILSYATTMQLSSLSYSSFLLFGGKITSFSFNPQIFQPLFLQNLIKSAIKGSP